MSEVLRHHMMPESLRFYDNVSAFLCAWRVPVEILDLCVLLYSLTPADCISHLDSDPVCEVLWIFYTRFTASYLAVVISLRDYRNSSLTY